MSALEATVRRLVGELESAKMLNERMSRTCHTVKALGQIEALTSSMFSVLRNPGQGEDGMPPVMPGIDQLLASTMEPVCKIYSELLNLRHVKPEEEVPPGG